MKHKEQGTVSIIEDIETGTGKQSGKPWRKQAVVFDFGNGKYPNPIKVTFWNDKVASSSALREGDEAEVEFYLRGSEYNGRYKVELNGAEVKVLNAVPRELAATPPSNAAKEEVADDAGDDEVLPF